MPAEPSVKRAFAFLDGQNLFHAAKEAFGSQDQDLSEVGDEIRLISIADNRWIKVACAFPRSPTAVNRRGINGTEWIPIDRALYDACFDSNDYRAKSKS